MSSKTELMKQEALNIHNKLQSFDPAEVKAAMKEYEQLVARFYNENRNRMAPEQYEAAKQDLEYFSSLIDLAVAYHKEKDL